MHSLKGLGVLAGIMTFGCGPKVVSIEMQPASITLSKKGEVAEIKATPKNAEGKAIEGLKLAFASEQPEVATVDATSGTVTAVKSGEAVVKATFEKAEGQTKVTVSIPANIVLTPAEVPLVGIGTKSTVTAKVLDEKGQPVNIALQWESPNPEIVSVVGGELTSKGVGSAKVFAVAAGLRAAVDVTVSLPPISSIEVTPPNVELKVGAEPAKLSPAAKDGSGNLIQGAQFTYVVADPKIATVDGEGNLTAVAKGKTKVTVSAGDKNATVNVTVKKK